MKEKIIKILKSHSYHHTEGVGVKSQFKYLAEIAFECCADEIMLALDQSQFTADEAEEHINQEVEKRIADIDQHGRIAVSVIKKKLWSMRFNEDDVKRETDGRRKRFIYGYTEAINDIAQWLTDTVSQNTRSRLTNPNNNPK